MKAVADVSYWYGFDASSLPPPILEGYRLNLPRLHAMQAIHDGKFDPTNIDQVYDLYLMAYEDEDIASDAATDAAIALVDQETKAPAVVYV